MVVCQEFGTWRACPSQPILQPSDPPPLTAMLPTCLMRLSCRAGSRRWSCWRQSEGSAPPWAHPLLQTSRPRQLSLRVAVKVQLWCNAKGRRAPDECHALSWSSPSFSTDGCCPVSSWHAHRPTGEEAVQVVQRRVQGCAHQVTQIRKAPADGAGWLPSWWG